MRASVGLFLIAADRPSGASDVLHIKQVSERDWVLGQWSVEGRLERELLKSK